MSFWEVLVQFSLQIVILLPLLIEIDNFAQKEDALAVLKLMTIRKRLLKCTVMGLGT